MALALTPAQWRCGCGRAITTPVTGTSSSFFAFTFEFEFPANPAAVEEDASCRSTQMSAAGESGAGARLGSIADLVTATVDFGGGAA